MTLQELLQIESGGYIAHEGKAHDENPPGRGSGRYPFGSGNRPHQHDWDLISRIDKLRAANPGIKDEEIAKQLGYYQTNKYGQIIYDEDGNPKAGAPGRLKTAMRYAGANIKRDKYEEICWYDTHIDPDTGKGYTDTKIAKLMGEPGESSIRSLRNTIEQGKLTKFVDIADKLRTEADKKGIIDVTSDIADHLGCSTGTLNTAIESLQNEGYEMKKLNFKNMSNPSFETTVVALCKPGEDTSRLFKQPERIKSITEVENSMEEKRDHDNDINSSLIKRGIADTPQISLDRIKVIYDEDGGTERDGLILIKAHRDENGNLQADSPDLSLGNARYAQIRIAVEGNRYIKGMAAYSEDISNDIVINSNKSREQGIDKALKKLELNKDGTVAKNMFGSSVVNAQTVMRDRFGQPILDKDGNQVASAINFVGANINDAHIEGRWGQWSKNLPSQFLTDLPLSVVKKQLALQAKIYEENLKEIESLNNPTVKRAMLIDYGNQLDAAACNLKAAPIGGQKTRVLMPVPSLKDNECYCPGLENGTTVALARFPHQGKWEIPILKVNNNNAEAKALIGDGADAICINHHNHGVLSGADSDGDTCIVIPMTRKNKTTGEFDKVTDVVNMPSLIGKVKTDDNGGYKLVKISDFDPTGEYGIGNPRFSNMYKTKKDPKTGKEEKIPTYHYFKTEQAKGKEMGIASNLIQDMRIKDASPDELVRADMYSMVVIDAKKHQLNWKQAYKDFGIDELKKKYQSHIDTETGRVKEQGASTLITLAGSPSQQKARAIWKASADSIDPVTGAKIYKDPVKTKESKASPEFVKIPGSNRYLKDDNGEKIQATWTGEVKQKPDGSYYYDAGSGKPKWSYKDVDRTENIKRMELVDDAFKLVADPSKLTETERAYAVYANHCKSLANQARKEYLVTKPIEYNKEAAAKYATEVAELKEAYLKASKNKARERQAQLLATSEYNAILNDHGSELDGEDRRKLRGQCVSDARDACGANKDRIRFTEKQWEAVNAGAIGPSMLDRLLDNADKDNYVKLALPKTSRISDSQKSQILNLYRAGWGYEAISEKLGISTGSVSNIISEK